MHYFPKLKVVFSSINLQRLSLHVYSHLEGTNKDEAITQGPDQ